MTPGDVFGAGYYWYNWMRRVQPEVLEEVRKMAPTIDWSAFELPQEQQPLEVPPEDTMPHEWWVRWGRGLLERVFPVMAVVMREEYLHLWLEGLRERLAEHGVTMDEVLEGLV